MAAAVAAGWEDRINVDELKKDLDSLGAQLRAGQGKADEDHFAKLQMWQRACFWIGYLTCWWVVNPISIFLISTGVNSRWTMIGHHVCHGGYDKLKGDHLHRRKFAVGWRRFVDWLDWMLPEAWNVEHGQYHHYQLGEVGDPDNVERNMAWIRGMQAPMPVKYTLVFLTMLVWKWYYYAPNTLKELHCARSRGKPDYEEIRKLAYPPMTIDNFKLVSRLGLYSELLFKVLAPYAIYTFLVLPMVFHFTLGSAAGWNCFYTMLLAEVLTNLHGFIVIVTNHCGDDCYRFDSTTNPSTGEFYLRQIIGSVNFSTGSDLIDFMHGFLNYQIEHHIWPDLSMLSYQKAQPLVKAICKKHGIPFLQQNVFWRVKKTVDVMVGNASQPVFKGTLIRSLAAAAH